MTTAIQSFARAELGGPGAYGRTFDDRAFAGPIALRDGRVAWLALVADGVGGAPGGGHAADRALESVLATLASSRPDDVPGLLERASHDAHASVCAAAALEPGLHDLATTLAVALVVGDALHVVNVGDSRIYLLQNDRLTQITCDHVWWRSAVRLGRADREHALRHPRAETLDRAIGLGIVVAPDLGLYLRGGPEAGETEERARVNQGLPLQPGDRVLVCSDGLVKARRDGSGRPYVSDDDIRRHLSDGTPEEAVHTLIGLARGRGADDNISAAVLALPKPTRSRSWRALWAPLIVGLVSAVAASTTTAFWLTSAVH